LGENKYLKNKFKLRINNLEKSGKVGCLQTATFISVNHTFIQSILAIKIMKENIQTTLFQLLKQKMAGEESMGNTLSNLLSVSSDSVYRRCRNETALTIQELKKICNHYSISFDALCEMGDANVGFNVQKRKKRIND
jgi:hypothetical protein